MIPRVVSASSRRPGPRPVLAAEPSRDPVPPGSGDRLRLGAMDVPRVRKRSLNPWLFGAGAVLLLVAVYSLLPGPAAQSVDRATLVLDTVRRGDVLRQVRGPGTLVPEDIRWISAVTAGRVERKAVEPGSAVNDGDVLVELSNPDVERQALDAQRQLAAAQAQLVSLRATLENQRLTQEATISGVQAQLHAAERQERAAVELAGRGVGSANEASQARDNAADLRERMRVESERLRFQGASDREQLASQASQLAMLRRIAGFQQRQVEAMKVRVPSAGVLQEMPLELGQWVNSGTLLAKVVQPGRLKAVLRISETQARDVTVGQPAQIDTRNGIVAARVSRIDPAVQNGTVAVDLAITGPLPRGARPDLSVDGTIDLERLRNVLYVGRPAFPAEGAGSLYVASRDGDQAVRVPVRFGRASAAFVEVLGGVREGDVVILSDPSAYAAAERIRLK